MNEFHSNSVDKKKLKCELCGIGVTDKGKLKMHMRAKHLKEKDEKTVYIKEENDEKNVYIKEENDEKTSYIKEEPSLSESNEFHSDCFELKCVLCDIGFTKNSELKQHMRTKHLEISHGKEKSLGQKIVEIMYPR